MRMIAFMIAIALGSSLLGQKYTHLVIEWGVTHSGFRRVYYSGDLPLKFETGPIIGAALRKELSQRISLEAGFFFRPYSEDIKRSDLSSYTGSAESYQFPLKFMVDLPVFGDRVTLYPSFGYILVCERPSGHGEIILYDPGDNSIAMTVSTDPATDKSWHSLVSGGVGARFRLVDELRINVWSGYTRGFTPMRQIEMIWWDDTGIEQTTTITTINSYWQVTASLSYPVVRIFKLLSEVGSLLE